jgi:hypothetical protein
LEESLKNLAPLKIHARCVADFPTIRENVKYCTSLGLRYFVPTPQKHGLEAVLVGSGPSVRGEVKNLKKKARDPKYLFFGIKGGHDFLIDNEIEPHVGLAVDPLEKIHKENFLRDAKGCKYFIASQCHPTLFDSLIARGKEVIIWHLLTNNLLNWSQEEGSPIFQHFMVPGGSTSGLRAMVLAHLMGFRTFHLYGYDSCLSVAKPNDKTPSLRKVNGEICEGKDEKGRDKAIEVVIADKTFWADRAMASQATEFQELIKSLWKADDPFVVRGYGTGMIQTIIRERYREGAADCLP